MPPRHLAKDRSLVSAAMALVMVTALGAVWWARRDGGWASAMTPAEKAATVEVLERAGGRQRRYAMDVWVPPHSEGRARIPLVLYLTGWGSGRGDNTVLLGTLANAGYAILALDDISQDPPYDDPRDEAARTAPFDISSEERVRTLIEMAHRRAALQVAKIADLLDRLAADRSLVPAFASLDVDVHRVGFLGYSFGGATGVELGKHDPRIGAAVNMDGWQLSARADERAAFPLLMINGVEARFDPQDEVLPDGARRNEAILNRIESERQSQQVAARPDSYRLYLRSARHGDFSDHVVAKRRVLSWLKSGGQLITARATRRALDGVIRAFFDTHLRQLPQASMDAAIAAHRDWIVLGQQPFR